MFQKKYISLIQIRFVKEDLAELCQLDYIREKFNLNKKEDPQELAIIEDEKNQNNIEQINENIQNEEDPAQEHNEEQYEEYKIQDDNNEEQNKEDNNEEDNIEQEINENEEIVTQEEQIPEINREEIEARIKELESEIEKCVEVTNT